MDPVRPDYNVHAVEAEVLSFWRARRLPPAGGVLGPPTGPVVRQFAGAWTQGDFPSLVAQRAVAADVDARYLELAGRRAVGTIRRATIPGLEASSPVPALLTALGVWTGGDGERPWDSEDRTPGVQAIVGRLAAKGILVTRDESFRVCPSCGSPRSPERIIYAEEEGDTFLVRFPVRVGDYSVDALVWVDVPWKLLGTSALLVNPDLRYVVAAYHRRDVRELVLTSASSLDRLHAWIPEATFEVLEEHRGREIEGIAYSYPLRHEFPMGGDLIPPAGTILAVPDVDDSGTGIVPLVPGHGPTDASIAARAGVAGWPLLTPKGKLDFTLMHKYAGLDLETANEFVLRDLSEAGAMLARLRVRRGVPHCAVCGTPLHWAPGRAWCLESSRLPAERRALFARLLPQEILPGQAEVAPWPVSEAMESDGEGAVALLECARCDRLEAPDGPAACPCGGLRRRVLRRLLPSSGATFSSWARFDPFLEGDSAHIYVGHRRRVPSLVHHLAALSGIQGSVADVNLTVVPTVTAADPSDLVARSGADAVRAALIRSESSEATGGPVADRVRQEDHRIRRWWALSREVVSRCDASMLTAFTRPIGGFLEELEVEDRAILARWERTRALSLAHYDQWAPSLVLRRAFHFLENDLHAYREIVSPRLALAGTPTTKRAALRTLAHLLRGLSDVLAPILPFTSETIHRSISTERSSVFEQGMGGLDRTLLSDDLFAAWDRWRTVLRSVDRFRRALGVPPTTVLPTVVLVLSADDMAERLRTEKDTLARLARVQRIEIASPKQPWTGRQRAMRPVESEVQKAYPSQASQIIHLLQHMAPRRWETTAGPEELTVVINGLPRRIFPSMVAFTDTLPERVAPVAWSLGEMYIERPAGVEFARPPTPPLSSDAFWLVRRLQRRLRATPIEPGQPGRIALVTAKDPLASELRAASVTIARYLALTELRVVEKSDDATPPTALRGRTRTGDRWSIHVPNLPPRRARVKTPREGGRLPRVSVSALSTPNVVEEVDYADEKLVAHAEVVRSLGQQLDDIIGIPLLGPAKVAIAWEHGVHSAEDLQHLSFEAVSALPGFGGPVAEVVVARLGGSVPTGARHRGVIGASTARTVRERSPPIPPAVAPPGNVSGSEPERRSSTDVAALVVPEPVPPDAPAPEIIGPDEPALRNEAEAEMVPPASEPVEPAPPSVDQSTSPLTEGSAPQPEPLPNLATPPIESPESISPAAELAPELEPPTDPVPLSEPLPPSDRVLPPPSPSPTSEQGIVPAAPLAEEPTVAPGEAPSESSIPLTDPNPVEETPAPLPPFDSSSLSPVETAAPPEFSPSTVVADAEPSPSDVTPPLSPLEVPSPELPEFEVEAVEPPAPQATDAPTSQDLESATEVAIPSPPVPSALPVDEEPPPGAELVGVVPPPAEPTPEAVPAEPAPIYPASSLSPAVEQAVVPAEAQVESVAPPAEEVPTPAPTITDEGPHPIPETKAPPPAPEIEARPESPRELETVPAPEPPVPPEVRVPAVSPAIEPELSAIPAVSPEVPAMTPPPEPEPPTPPSGIELTIGDSLVSALSGFLESTAAGHHGVCVVRESPERIRARVGSRPIEVFWLTNIGRGPALRPADLEAAWAFLSRKLLGERVTAFFLEGIEYLVRLHGADVVLNGLVQFDRLARENDARIWVYLAPALMKPADLERFRSTFGSGSPPG